MFIIISLLLPKLYKSLIFIKSFLFVLLIFLLIISNKHTASNNAATSEVFHQQQNSGIHSNNQTNICSSTLLQKNTGDLYQNQTNSLTKNSSQKNVVINQPANNNYELIHTNTFQAPVQTFSGFLQCFQCQGHFTSQALLTVRNILLLFKVINLSLNAFFLKQSHMLRDHQLPYWCTVCNKGFAGPNQLVVSSISICFTSL